MINCLLVDDEPYALELLSKYIADFKDMNIVAKCRGVKEAIPILQSEKVDLLFLDVKMPKVTGIEFLQEMPHLPDVILTTAYRDYALQAYEFGVLDYLLKPISFIRFSKAIERYKDKRATILTDGMLRPIVFKSGFEYHKVIPTEILYIQSAKEYVSIVCTNGKYLVRSSMGDILSALPNDDFIQIHKSYIVPTKKIVSVGSAELMLNDNIKLPVGRSFAKAVRASFSS